jgi:hypothetical protein
LLDGKKDFLARESAALAFKTPDDKLMSVVCNRKRPVQILNSGGELRNRVIAGSRILG